MIYDTPHTPADNNLTSQIQQGTAPVSEDSLQQEGLQQAVKEIVLRRLIDGSIKDNEDLSVLTGVRIMDMRTDRVLIDHNQNTEHFAASVNKLPVALLALQDIRARRLNLDQTMTWLSSDVRGGYGDYDQPGAPTSATLREVIYDMLNKSGNTAVRVVVNYALGGASAVNGRWQQYPQLSHTYLQPLDASRFYLGYTTPHDSLWVMEQLTSRNDRPARFMQDAMATNIFEDYGVRSQLSGDQWILLINKVGILDDVDGNNRHDVGIIQNNKTHHSYGFSIMTTSPYTSAEATPQAEQSLKDMGRYLLRYAGERRGNNQPPAKLFSAEDSRRHIERKVLY